MLLLTVMLNIVNAVDKPWTDWIMPLSPWPLRLLLAPPLLVRAISQAQCWSTAAQQQHHQQGQGPGAS
jgi:hypothetical protein